MTTLNKTFQPNNVLTAAELNAITGKVDEIVELLSSLEGDDPASLDEAKLRAEIEAKVKAAKEELEAMIAAAIANAEKNVESLRDAMEKEIKEIDTDERWAQFRSDLDDLESAMISLTPEGIDLAALKGLQEKVDEINAIYAGLHVEAGKVEILAGLVDPNDKIINNEKYTPATIVAAVDKNENGEYESKIGISADQVLVGGDVVLTGEITGIKAKFADIEAAKADIATLQASQATIEDQLDAANAKIDNLDVPDLATIKQAVIGDIDIDSIVDDKLDGKADLTDFEKLVADLGDISSLIVAGNTLMEKLTTLDAEIKGRLDAAEAKIDKLDVSDTLTANSLIAKGENDYPVIKINATDGIQLQMNERGDTAISVNIDGSGSLANGGISWNSQGDLTVNGTFKIGAAYIEYITEGLSAVVGFDERQESLTANIEITNSNNFDIYCIYRWYADGINSQWSTGGQSDAVLVKAHESRTFTHTVLADDIQEYRLATHPSIDSNYSGADIVSAYRYIQRS